MLQPNISLDIPKEQHSIEYIILQDPMFTSTWISILKDNVEIGVIRFIPITYITYAVHMNLFKEYQNNKLAIEVYKPLVEFCKQNTIHKLIATVAVENKRMLKVLKQTNFKPCGVIRNGIIHDDKLQDVNLYELEII